MIKMSNILDHFWTKFRILKFLIFTSILHTELSVLIFVSTDLRVSSISNLIWNVKIHHSKQWLTFTTKLTLYQNYDGSSIYHKYLHLYLVVNTSFQRWNNFKNCWKILVPILMAMSISLLYYYELLWYIC